ncbi:MAG: DsbA family protein, partial [Lysobacteraceae bacterium]
LEQTQAGMFKALAEQQRLGAGKIDDIAKLYAELGVDAEAFKATAASFAVNTQISRSQKTLVRWGVESTPTLVVAGKYRVPPTGDRGHEGMLQTARWLAQREIAQQQAAAR